jgi:hypothetical protein
MTTINFPEFVSLLPRGDDLRREAAKKLPRGVSWVEVPNPCFVEPDLQVKQPIEPGRTSVVLLYAPGAVGKSTLASELASRARAFLWDLSKFQVGSRTFSGTILDLYGFVSTGVQKRLAEGKFLFVLDALDEAQVRSGSQNFDAFISDLAEALRDPREKPCVVLLARSDTADWVHLLFEDAGVPLARYQIEYFDNSRAVSFIEKRLDDRRRGEGAQLLHRQQARPFSEALSVLFDLIYNLFGVSEQEAWEDSRVKNFLGYAPVLEALTDYVDVTNYMTLIQELREDAGAARDPWKFLNDIIHRLSHREQAKVQDAVRVQLGSAAKAAGWSDWARLYTPTEQCSRVLGRALRVPVDPLGSSLPLALARQYEEALETILPQHPFLSGRQFANVVFKEFIYAWGITRCGGPLSDGLRNAMRDREDPFLPSQLFSRFIVNIGDEGAAVLDGQDFGILYESFLSRAQEVGLTLVQAGEEIQASIVLDREEESELEILDTGSGVHFWRRLGNADVEVRGRVRLGLPGQRFLLGPATNVDCGQLAMECEGLDVDVAGNVRIRADSYIADLSQLSIRVRNETQGRLAVSWPGIGHPWVLYRVPETRGPLALSETVRGDTLRKFIMMFRRQRTRQERTLLKARWSQDQLNDRTELLDLALRRGVLRRIPGRDQLELSSEYDSLRTLVEEMPSLAPNARLFVVEYLGSELAGRL